MAATEENRIANTLACNAIVSDVFPNTNRSHVGDSYQYSALVPSSGRVSVAGGQTIPIWGGSKYIQVKEPVTLNISIYHMMRLGSASGTVLLNWTVDTQPIIRIGVASTVSDFPTFVHYIDVTPNLGSASELTTKATVDIPIPQGSWYIYAFFQKPGSISNITLASGSASGKYLYSIWDVVIGVSSLGWCPTKSVLEATHKFRINGSYESNQCVKIVDLTKGLGYINYTLSDGETSGNIIGFYKGGSTAFNGSTITDWYAYAASCTLQQSNRESSGNIWKLSTSDDNWTAGNYYLVLSPSSFKVYHINLTSDQVTRLNGGETLNLSGYPYKTLT